MREFRYTNRFKEDLSKICAPYCESLTDQEFEWLIDQLDIKLKEYLKEYINNM